jgi:hypothetical protein
VADCSGHALPQAERVAPHKVSALPVGVIQGVEEVGRGGRQQVLQVLLQGVDVLWARGSEDGGQDGQQQQQRVLQCVALAPCTGWQASKCRCFTLQPPLGHVVRTHPWPLLLLRQLGTKSIY